MIGMFEMICSRCKSRAFTCGWLFHPNFYRAAKGGHYLKIRLKALDSGYHRFDGKLTQRAQAFPFNLLSDLSQ